MPFKKHILPATTSELMSSVVGKKSDTGAKTLIIKPSSAKKTHLTHDIHEESKRTKTPPKTTTSNYKSYLE
jgi:hypothetical protein